MGEWWSMFTVYFALEATVGPEVKPPWTVLWDGKQRRDDYTGTARIARTIWTRMKLPFLSEVVAGSMWRPWACEPKPNAVITSLKHAFF